MKDTLIFQEKHESERNLDTLISSTGLRRQLEAFLLAGKCEDLSERTLDDYRQKIGQLLKYLDANNITDPQEVTVSHIRGFLLFKQSTVAPASVHSYYRSAKRFFRWMVFEGTLESTPMAAIRAPKVPRKVIRPYQPDEIRDLLTAVGGRGILTLRDRAIILTFIDTGVRRSELAGMMKRDVNPNNNTIRVMGKGRKERVVGIDRVTLGALVRYVKERTDESPHLWVTIDGRPLKSRAIYDSIRRFGKKASLNEVRNSPHTFRHTFATMSIRNGGNLFQVQSALGHATLTMTRRYAATLDSEAAAEAHRKFSPIANMKF